MILTRHQIDFLVLRANQLIAANVDPIHKEPAELIVQVADKVKEVHGMSLGEWLCPMVPQIKTESWRTSNDEP